MKIDVAVSKRLACDGIPADVGRRNGADRIDDVVERGLRHIRGQVPNV